MRGPRQVRGQLPSHGWKTWPAWVAISRVNTMLSTFTSLLSSGCEPRGCGCHNAAELDNLLVAPDWPLGAAATSVMDLLRVSSPGKERLALAGPRVNQFLSKQLSHVHLAWRKVWRGCGCSSMVGICTLELSNQPQHSRVLHTQPLLIQVRM